MIFDIYNFINDLTYFEVSSCQRSFFFHFLHIYLSILPVDVTFAVEGFLFPFYLHTPFFHARFRGDFLNNLFSAIFNSLLYLLTVLIIFSASISHHILLTFAMIRDIFFGEKGFLKHLFLYFFHDASYSPCLSFLTFSSSHTYFYVNLSMYINEFD